MDSVVALINGNNGIFVLGILTAVFASCLVLVKKGYLTLNKGGLNISGRQMEQALIRDQLEYVDNTLDACIRVLPKNLQNDRALVVISKVKDAMERTIIFNHIRNDDTYIQLKQKTVYNTVLKWTFEDYFISAEFKQYCDDLTETMIKQLYKMREESK